MGTTQRDMGENHMNTEAETGLLCLQARPADGRQKPGEDTQSIPLQDTE